MKNIKNKEYLIETQTSKNASVFLNTNTIDPYYISGLTQADGSFFCSIEKTIKKDQTKGLTFTPVFDITVDLDSKNTLDILQEYFGCGKVITKMSDHSARYRVLNRKDLINTIIPLFKKYPVFCNKLHAFNLFTQILQLLSVKINERDHIKILTLSVSMNTSSKRSLEDILELSKIIGLSKTVNKIPDIFSNLTSEFNAGFLAGMIDGDGSFNITFPQNLKKAKIKPVLSLCFGPTALVLYEESKKYLGISGVLYKANNIFVLKIANLDQIFNYVIPFMDANPLYTKKMEHYNIWKEVCLILKKEKNLSKSSFLKIVELAYDMNKKGKRRKLSKEEYIKIINNFYTS